nr:hypothetical protein [Tanacetum cinerariifolium]
NNLKVYEADIKGSSGSTSNPLNVAFVSIESTSRTNELNADYSVSTAAGHSYQAQGSLSYADELMFLFFANQSSTPQLDKEDLEVKRFYKKTRRKMEFNGKEPVGFDKNKVECFNYHRIGHFARNYRSSRNSGNKNRDVGNAGYQSYQVEEEETDFGLMAFTSNPSSSASSNSKLDKALKEKEDLKAKLEKFETSSKNRTKLLDSQISAKVQTVLGYDSQFNVKEVLDIKEEEVTKTVFDNHLSDEENSVANDRFKKGKGYHAVPPPPTGNYMPPKSDVSFVGLDESIYKFKISETVTSLAKDEKDALETSTVYVKKPKEDRSSAPLIEDWETDSDDDNVFTHEHILPKIDFVRVGESVKHVKPVKTTEQTKKSKNFSSSPKVDRKDWHWKMTQKLGLDRMAKKYVLPNNVGKGTGHRESRRGWNNVQRINHQNNYAPTAVITRSGIIPICAAKPKAAASTSVAKPVNMAAASTSVAKPVNTARPKRSVNFSRTRSNFHKSHSPIRRSFYNATTHSRRYSTERVNTTRSKAVSAVKGNRVTVVKTSAVTDIPQKDKNKAKRTKPSTGLEEREKAKPKAYSSLMGQPAPVLWVGNLIGQKDVEDDLRAQKDDLEFVINQGLGLEPRWPPRITLGRLLPHARGLEFNPCRGGFPSEVKKEWGLSLKANVRVLHTAQLNVTASSNH